MNSIPDVSETEEYYSIDEPRTARMLWAVLILFALGPVACGGMFGPQWATIDNDQINKWYTLSEPLGAGIFLLAPPLLFLVNRLHRWLRHGTLRWMIVAMQWGLVGIFLGHLSDPWQQAIVSDWQSSDCVLIQHPVFSSCFYLSALFSSILWITFRGNRQWFRRALYEILPFILITAGLYYLSIADRPELNCG